MGRSYRRPIVAGKHHQGVVAEFQVVEGLHDAAEGIIHLRDAAVMGTVGGRVGWVELGVFFISSDGLVGFVKADV